MFRGQPIVAITLQANGMRFRADSNNVMRESTAGSGQVWVLSGDLTLGGTGSDFVNVAQTNAIGIPEYACDDGVTGNGMFLTENGGDSGCGFYAYMRS
jgi:hypothetical protein